jgi:lactoylglutathione lyase
MVDDLQAACDEMEKKEVKFQKKPSDGKMKTIAFALDPDGYWVEIVTRKTEEQVRA